MQIKKIVTLCILLFLTLPLIAQIPPLVSTEQRDLSGLCNLEILCNEKSVEIFLDNAYAGISPLLLKNLQPGYYIITLRKEGFHPQYLQINLRENTHTKIFVVMELITGFLDLEITPMDARIETGGRVYSPGIIKLPIGKKELLISAFGFEKKTVTAEVFEDILIKVQLNLEPADFEVANWELTRNRFNPQNRGSFGQLEAQWYVTAPGNAITFVFDMDGNEVFSIESPEFDDWYQSIIWDGRDNYGQILPDGIYRIQSRIYGPDGEETMHEALAGLDSSIMTRAGSSWLGISGTQYSPFSETFSESSALAGLSLDYVLGESAGLAVSIYFGLSLADSLEAGFNIFTNLDAASIGAAIKLPFAGIFAFLLDGQYGVSEVPSWLRSGVVLSSRSGIFGFALFPAFAMYFDNPPTFRVFLSSAIELSDYWGSISLSAQSWSQEMKDGLAFRDGISLALGASMFLGNTPNILGIRVFTGLPDFGLPQSLGLGIDLSSRL